MRSSPPASSATSSACPTSDASAAAATELGIPLATLATVTAIDVTIDGADEVDPALNLVKGGGGALLHEKIVAQASRREVIVVDAAKPSPRLGTLHVLPVEVVPFGEAAERGLPGVDRRDGRGPGRAPTARRS